MHTVDLAQRFVRTEAGRAEIRAKAIGLSRIARNLLLVIDDSCPAESWITRVRGCSRDDLGQLLDAGLVMSCAGRASARAAAAVVTLDQALSGWTYDALYTLLTHEARERFGLIRGYRIVLEIEGAAGLPDMQEITRRFVEQLRRSHGEETAMRFRRQLGATD